MQRQNFRKQNYERQWTGGQGCVKTAMHIPRPAEQSWNTRNERVITSCTRKYIIRDDGWLWTQSTEFGQLLRRPLSVNIPLIVLIKKGQALCCSMPFRSRVWQTGMPPRFSWRCCVTLARHFRAAHPQHLLLVH